MRSDDHWRQRSMSARLGVSPAPSPADDSSFMTQSISRGREFCLFLADFWQSTPHPMAQMALVVGWAVVVVAVNDAGVLKEDVVLDDVAASAIKEVLAFLIVFRTNQSYNRWWEGRILWGEMHKSCVQLSQQAATWIVDQRLALRVMNFAITYAYTVKQILRRERLHAEDLEGVINPAEVDVMNRLSLMVMPYYCTDVMRQCIKKGLTEHPQTYGVEAVATAIDAPVSQLALQFAHMARLKNTPQPDTFRVMLHMFTMIYLLLLPVITYDALGMWVVPEVFLTAYLMLGLQLAASYLEDPFGHYFSDLPLDLYVDCIARQCREAFYVGEKSGSDLTLGRIGDKSDSTNTDPARGGWGRTGVGSIGTDTDCCALQDHAVAATGKEKAVRVVELKAPVR